MDLENLIDKASGCVQLACLSTHKKRTSQILTALEGMSIWEARELLQACSSVLEQIEISYSVSRSDTTE